MEILKVVIERSKWLRGTNNENSALKLGDKYCCLGFACKALGFKDDQIDDVPTPEALKEWVEDDDKEEQLNKLGYFVDFGQDEEGLSCNDNISVTRLVQYNDSAKLVDKVREAKIIKEGKKINVEFSFVD